MQWMIHKKIWPWLPVFQFIFIEFSGTTFNNSKIPFIYCCMESESWVICSDFVNLIREIKIALNQNIETEVHISDILFMYNSHTHTHMHASQIQCFQQRLWSFCSHAHQYLLFRYIKCNMCLWRFVEKISVW